jgi:hypothetical protein
MPAQLERHRSNFVVLSASPPLPPSSICKLIRSSRKPPGSLAAESQRSAAGGMARAGSGRTQSADLAGSAAELRLDTLKLGRRELRDDRLDWPRQYRTRPLSAVSRTSWDFYLVVDARVWWSGKEVLLSPLAVEAINWPWRKVELNVTRDQVRSSPPWNPEKMIDQMSEKGLHPAALGLAPDFDPASTARTATKRQSTRGA